MTEGEPVVQKQTGLEFWFTPLGGSVQPAIPPRYKMAMVTGGIVFALLSTLIPQIRQLTSAFPVLLSTLLGVVIMVLLMTCDNAVSYEATRTMAVKELVLKVVITWQTP